jgi:glutamate racemase
VLTASGTLRDENAPPPRHRFAATGDPEPFRRLGRRFLGPEIAAVQTAEVVAPLDELGSDEARLAR